MEVGMALSTFLQALKEAAEGSHGELKVFVQHKEIPGRKGKTKTLVRHQILATVANTGTFLEEEKENEIQKYSPKTERKLMKRLLLEENVGLAIRARSTEYMGDALTAGKSNTSAKTRGQPAGAGQFSLDGPDTP